MTYERDAAVRRSQRVIRMLCELHRLGYQRLRVMPYFYPLAYRVAIGPAPLFSERNGAYSAQLNLESFAVYSSASQSSYFGWQDAHTDTARQLADKFILRFGDICAAGKGRDWPYAGWLSELMGVMERQGGLPFVMEEYFEPPPEALDHLPMWRRGQTPGRFDLPPPAVATPSELVTPALNSPDR
jgi:hypothetical protein